MKLLFAFTLTLTVMVSGLQAQEITMFPGFFGETYYQDDVQISKNQIKNLMLESQEANQYWQKSARHYNIALVSLAAEIGFLVWTLSVDDKDDVILPLVGTLVTGGISVGFSLSAASLKKKAILTYNNDKDTANLQFGPTYNGMGLVYSFS